MEYKDYYRILAVDRQASADEIKKAYRKLARKYHPDISKEADASQRMAEINEANAVLSDPEKRAAYDALADAPRRSAGAGGFQPPRTGKVRTSTFAAAMAPCRTAMRISANSSRRCSARAPARAMRAAGSTDLHPTCGAGPARQHRAGPAGQLPRRPAQPAPAQHGAG